MEAILAAKLEYLKNNKDVFIVKKKDKWYYGSRYKTSKPQKTKTACIENAFDHVMEIESGYWDKKSEE